MDELNLEIEPGNLIYRSLPLREGMDIQVSLKSSSIRISVEETGQ